MLQTSRLIFLEIRNIHDGEEVGKLSINFTLFYEICISKETLYLLVGMIIIVRLNTNWRTLVVSCSSSTNF